MTGCGCLHWQAIWMCWLERWRDKAAHYLSVSAASKRVPSGFPCRSPKNTNLINQSVPQWSCSFVESTNAVWYLQNIHRLHHSFLTWHTDSTCCHWLMHLLLHWSSNLVKHLLVQSYVQRYSRVVAGQITNHTVRIVQTSQFFHKESKNISSMSASTYQYMQCNMRQQQEN